MSRGNFLSNNLKFIWSALRKVRNLKKVKTAILLRCLGPEEIRIFNTFDFANDAEKENLANVMEKFEKYCMPKKNLFYERHRFNTRIQNKEENFDTFLTDIRNIVINCEYGTLEDDLLKDRIIAGIYSEELKSKLLKLNYDNVTLNKVIEECRAFESSKSNLLKMKN